MKYRAKDILEITGNSSGHHYAIGQLVIVRWGEAFIEDNVRYGCSDASGIWDTVKQDDVKEAKDYHERDAMFLQALIFSSTKVYTN